MNLGLWSAAQAYQAARRGGVSTRQWPVDWARRLRPHLKPGDVLIEEDFGLAARIVGDPVLEGRGESFDLTGIYEANLGQPAAPNCVNCGAPKAVAYRCVCAYCGSLA